MAVTPAQRRAEITLGPVLFNWAPERWRDFYFRIADEAPVDIVYLGEVVCSKRDPLFSEQYEAVIGRLEAAGKTVVHSTLAEVMLSLDRKMVAGVCADTDWTVEANDASALPLLKGRAHHIGPFMNVYNERTVALLAERGAVSVCLPAELPATAIRALCQRTQGLAVAFETQVFGRMSLALSARCYHARAHGRTKDSCQFVCDNDPDGLELRTLDGRSFLTVNGIQTLSSDYLNLIAELPDLLEAGVSRFRLSPHTCDMVKVAAIFRSVLDRGVSSQEGLAQLEAMMLPAPFSNGFYHGQPGHRWVAAG
ncbi:MAG: U32 family peptidase [Hyphomicrobiales bacterium]|nr:U32 family peptidase [Hyphomicrobiales bacterium]